LWDLTDHSCRGLLVAGAVVPLGSNFNKQARLLEMSTLILSSHASSRLRLSIRRHVNFTSNLVQFVRLIIVGSDCSVIDGIFWVAAVALAVASSSF